MIGLQNFENITEPTTVYPYGAIKDDPGDDSGTPVNVQTNGDLQQFFARIAANAGIAANGLPDNVTNGFQLVQVLNKLINQETSGMALAWGSIAGNNLPVLMSGMVVTSSGFGSAISPGWFFYNGKFVFFLGGEIGPLSTGIVALVKVGNSDGLPTATVTTGPPATNTTTFPFSILATPPSPFALNQAIGNINDEIAGINSLINGINTTITGIDTEITTLNTEVATIETEIALAAWTALPALTTGWNTATNPRYTKDGTGRVYLQGSITNSVPWTSGDSNTAVFTLPIGYRPSQQVTLVASFNDPTTGNTVPIIIEVSGTANANPGGVFIFPTGDANCQVYLDTLFFITL